MHRFGRGSDKTGQDRPHPAAHLSRQLDMTIYIRRHLRRRFTTAAAGNKHRRIGRCSWVRPSSIPSLLTLAMHWILHAVARCVGIRYCVKVAKRIEKFFSTWQPHDFRFSKNYNGITIRALMSISPCSTKSVVNNIDEALVMLPTRAREVLQADRRWVVADCL